MTVNVNKFRNTLSIPSDWKYDAATDLYIGPEGWAIEGDDVRNLGFTQAHVKTFSGRLTNLPKDWITGNTVWPPKKSPAGIDNLNIADPASASNSAKSAKTVTFEGQLGKITINLDTGELTIPPNVGRDEAIRDFWLAFQKVYKSTDRKEHERQIADLKHDIEVYKDKADQAANIALSYKNKALQESSKIIVEKIMAKYGGDKFIMIKPEDLIKFIEQI